MSLLEHTALALRRAALVYTAESFGKHSWLFLHVSCRGRNVFHTGMARAGHRLGTATAGEVAQKAMKTGKGNYLANLILYPGMNYCAAGGSGWTLGRHSH